MSQGRDGTDGEEHRAGLAQVPETTAFGMGPEEVLGTVEALLLGGPPVLTRVQLAERVGVPLDQAQTLWHSLGFPHTDDDEVAFTEADVTALGQAVELIRAGILDQDSQNAMVRTWGRSYARLAEWQASLLAGLAVAADDPEERLEELAADVIPLVDSLQSYVWRRHLFSASSRLLTRPTGSEAALAVGFVDIVGYTSRSKKLGESELVELVERFEDLATGTTTDHGGRLIKTIGDEVLFVADTPADAARIALELVERNGQDETFPEVRAGLAYGAVVSRLGDVYGPTVNIASRLTTLARPATVLVDQGMHAALSGPDGPDGPDGDQDPAEGDFRLRRVRRTSVKGYQHLEPWRLKRAKGEPTAS